MASKVNPLIAALLKQFPLPDSSRAQRVSWLRMAAMSMDNIYGADGAPLEIPDFLGAAAPAVDLQVPPLSVNPLIAKPQLVRTVEPPRFFIDYAGAARKAPSMEAINPEQLGGDTLFDDRGEHGDLGSILWADGRRGVLGLQLSISATPVAKRA